MKPRALAVAAEWMEGECREAEPGTLVAGAAIDSREVRPGDLFFALPGERAHGIDFAAEALGRGACAVVTDAAHLRRLPSIVVADAARALSRLAARVRALEEGVLPAVAITGSVGKTTACGYAATLLRAAGIAHGPPKSFNNALGVPLSILGAPQDCDFLVREFGTNAPGAVRGLARIARPRVACITAIAPAHLAGLGTIEGVAAEKLSLCAALPENEEAWLPAEAAREFARFLPATRARVRTFGPGGELELVPGSRAGEWRLLLAGLPAADPFPWQAPFPHSPRNLEAALAAGVALGIPPAALVSRAGALALPPLRGECKTHAGVDLLLDCYNSNPAALESSIARLEREAARGRRVCVVGTMEELGVEEEGWHRRLGERLASPALDAVYLVGRARNWYLAGLRERGGDGTLLTDDDESAVRLAGSLRPGDRVLFKASRRDGLERFAARVAEHLDRSQ
ncbi:MAG: Mur ligase domain-containing protein [Planctomycetes bacterium]|nr:Mur ligase domain-containing protein [Planctomycetota bacterium]